MYGFGTPELLLVAVVILAPILTAYFFGKRMGRLEGRLEERDRK